MSKFFKTVGGEVYGKCSILFGPTPVKVSDAQLAAKSPIDGRTCAERLAADPRLVEVDVPSVRNKEDADANEKRPATSAADRKPENDDDRRKV